MPFFGFFIVTKLLYSETESPDLIRLGYIPNIYKDYGKDLLAPKEEKSVKLTASKTKKYKVMTIGDSFSEQTGIGYKNFLAEDYTVLHIDRFISGNQIQTLINLANGDFFSKYEIEYVVLQNIERHIVDNILEVQTNSKLDNAQIDSIVKAYNAPPPAATTTTPAPAPKTEESKYEFFSRTTLEFPLYALPNYFFNHNYLSHKRVYNYDLNSKNYFSNHSDKLLVYDVDVSQAPQNGDMENCKKLNKILNDLSGKLKKKNVKLIFLPSPDKYDLYYDLIQDKRDLVKPTFFDNFGKLSKEYIYIDSKKVLTKHIHTQPDLYYYDDTHWTTFAAKIISNSIKDVIKK